MQVDHLSLNARGDERAGAGFEQGAAIAQVAWVAMECFVVTAALNRGCALDGGADALVRAAAHRLQASADQIPVSLVFGLVFSKAADVMIMPLMH